MNLKMILSSIMIFLALFAFANDSNIKGNDVTEDYDYIIKKKGGKKNNCGEVEYDYVRKEVNHTEKKVQITCNGKGPNGCFGYSFPSSGSGGCNEPVPPFPVPVCDIEQVVANRIDFGQLNGQGIHAGQYYYIYENGNYDATEDVYEYDLKISKTPLW